MSGQFLTGKKVLVLEDEPLIAMLIVDALQRAGSKVVGPAYSAEQALALIAKENVDVAVLDVHLGNGATSAPVADALSEAGIPFIFATGHGQSALRTVDQGRPFLGKPYSDRDVIAAIAAALDAPAIDRQQHHPDPAKSSP